MPSSPTAATTASHCVRYASSRNRAWVIIEPHIDGETVSVAPHRTGAQTQIVGHPDSSVPVAQPGRLRIQSAVS
ncbi:hypothetical protein C7H84_26485 [Burkholderia sp. Nafp2/4-1b]|nr:hypothetical protein C7H84_26485 [Burkholderia sp. Nafp2/4-1b]